MTTGLALSRRFFEKIVEPILFGAVPGLRFGAARIGDGSEVLGFDTAMSADHNWGPKVQIFLGDDDDFPSRAEQLMAALDASLPEQFEGIAVRYADAGRPAAGQEFAVVSWHGVELHTVAGWVRWRMGRDIGSPWTAADWLGLSEQVLLTATAGAVFRDDLGALAAMRDKLAYLPRDIWLYKLMSQWARIGEEHAFVGRAGDLGDDLGSRVIAARLVRDAMRLCFLVERRYAPYPKWFGTAFSRLQGAGLLAEPMGTALSADSWTERETALVECLRRLAVMQQARHIPGAVPPRVNPYYARPFAVINAEEIADGIRGAIDDPEIAALPAIGGIDQFSDSTAILSHPIRSSRAQLAAMTTCHADG